MKRLMFLGCFDQKLSKKNIWGVGSNPPPPLVQEGLKIWDDLKVNVDENKLVKWYTHFEKDYPEVFKVEIEENKAAV